MKLFWAPQTRAQRGIWMLEEAGIEYAMERIDLASAHSKKVPLSLACLVLNLHPAPGLMLGKFIC
jgi:hypothetical protein